GVTISPARGRARSNESAEKGSGATAAEATGVGRGSRASPRSYGETSIVMLSIVMLSIVALSIGALSTDGTSTAARSGNDDCGESGVGDIFPTGLKSFGGVESSLRSMSSVTSLDKPSGSSLETMFVDSKPSSIVGGSIGSITVGGSATMVGDEKGCAPVSASST